MRRISLILACTSLALSLSAQQTIDVAVMCINDFHGGFVRDDYKGIPGAASVVETLDSLKRVYPAHIVVSAGDNFGGSYFYQATRSRSLMPQFFQDCGITLSGVGNHEFDEGLSLLLDQWRTGVECRPQSWQMEYVSANIRCDANSPFRTEGTSRPQFCNPYSVRSITLPDGREFQLAFVGMTTSSTTTQASASKLGGLSFEGNVQAVLDSLRHTSDYSRVAGADARILLVHQGTDTKIVQRGCLVMLEPYWSDVDSASLTGLDDDQFCGILSSHSHKIVCGHIGEHGYPVTQGESHGKNISMLRLTLDAQTLELLNVKPMIIPVVPRSTFSPKAARLQAQIDELLTYTYTKGGAVLGDHLTYAIDNIAFDRSTMKHDLTRMGQLVTSGYAHAVRQAMPELDVHTPVVGISHIGGIRAGLQKGAVRVMDVGEVLPFDNALRVFRMSGAQLKALFEFGLHNERYGYMQYADIRCTLDKRGHVKSLTYIASDGKQLPITDKTTCYLVADEFVSGGGDGYDASLFPAGQEVKGVQMPHITDAFINYLRTLEKI